MGTRRRLDAELVRRGLARSREQAAEPGRRRAGAGRRPGRGQARHPGRPARSDPGHRRGAGAAVRIARGHKLAGALAAFPGLRVAGRRCLDAGASTGGFTDVLLRAGAAHVIAADVGYGQLAWALRTDERVTVLDRVNVRQLQPEQVAPGPDLVTADLSFISLTLVLPALVGARPRRPISCSWSSRSSRWARAGWERVAWCASRACAGGGRRGGRGRRVALGLGVAGLAASPLPGPAGNVEYFLWLRRGAPPLDAAELRRVIAEGPQ